jgi:rhamnogalacturonyl hydrolase YesR
VVDFSIVSLSVLCELISVTFRLENKNQIWDDTLMMTGSFGQKLELIPVIPLAKIGLILDRPQYIEEGKSIIRRS